MYVEVIYETGAKSVAQYDSEEEARSALEGQHNRAVSGEPGGPYQGPAERIKKVLMYDEHPASLNESGLVNAEEAKAKINELIDAMAMGGEVSVMQLAAQVRELSNPHAPVETPFDSQYKMQETGELAGGWNE